mmetsp:Transcript_16095/g.20434  ORF Transcript_16095/g.20434 Transcript_16095/m.20434 type:complete len:89 (-) Transcript_16095:2807-3073(-)
MHAKVNPEDLETREVFYTRFQDGFSLKSKANMKEEERFAQNTTPVKKTRPAKHKSGFIQGRRLFTANDDDEQPARTGAAVTPPQRQPK